MTTYNIGPMPNSCTTPICSLEEKNVITFENLTAMAKMIIQFTAQSVLGLPKASSLAKKMGWPGL